MQNVIFRKMTKLIIMEYVTSKPAEEKKYNEINSQLKRSEKGRTNVTQDKWEK